MVIWHLATHRNGLTSALHHVLPAALRRYIKSVTACQLPRSINIRLHLASLAPAETKVNSQSNNPASRSNTLIPRLREPTLVHFKFAPTPTTTSVFAVLPGAAALIRQHGIAQEGSTQGGHLSRLG